MIGMQGKIRRATRYGWLLAICTLLAGACEIHSTPATDVQLLGAGGTFPAPLYERWFAEFVKQRPDVELKYNAVGSGAGVRLFTDELVDFGASDEAMSDDEIARVDRGVRLLPMTSGGIVLAYNLSDAKGNAIGDLRLSRQAYSDIYLGKITHWNDPEITRHNPDVVLPDLPIQVEYRLDSSGTTLAFTRHLSAVSDEWRRGPGVGKGVEWPVGAGMPKDKGVLSAIRRMPGAIGYLSYAYAMAQSAPMAELENASGAFVKPTPKSLEAALRSTEDIPADLRMSNPDPTGPDTYPIVTYSWILCYRTYDDPRKLALLKEVLAYGLKQGQQASGELGYVPLPDTIVSRASRSLK